MSRVTLLVIASCSLLVAGIAFTTINLRRYRRSRDQSYVVTTVAFALISLFSAASVIVYLERVVGQS